MQIKRTASSGVLLELDGVRILLDGVCRQVGNYLPTPQPIRQALLADLPDAVAFTHRHPDHYDAAFASAYQEKTAGPILGPADIPFCKEGSVSVGGVKITTVESRHLGKSDGARHCSMIIEGSLCVWLMGDAAPAQWRKRTELPKPDVLLVPYPYAIGSAWELTRSLGAKTVVLLHLPAEDNDPYLLWDGVRQTVGQEDLTQLVIPKMGESVSI